jgi:flagellar basal-body rod modification protein FlgD
MIPTPQDTVAAGPTVQGASSRSEGGTASPSLSSDFDTFLKLLTAQIRNQDPLEPGDATKYASQLATFSNVEQAVRTNTLLEEMLEGQARAELTEFAGWVGRDVLHDGPVHLDDDPVELRIDAPDGLDGARLVIRSDGLEVGRVPIDPSQDRFTWKGEDGAGGRVGPGTYELSVEGTIGAAPVDPTVPLHHSTVREVVRQGGETLLMLPGGIAIAPDRVTGLAG